MFKKEMDKIESLIEKSISDYMDKHTHVKIPERKIIFQKVIDKIQSEPKSYKEEATRSIY
ncbi:MAG: hypothetical protein PHP06_04215 [Clostridia bacterium]|nr:hypothetical protein [Clostridia bacterium]